MKIGIHLEVPSACIGGAEFVVALLAHFLRQKHQVEIVHHRPHLTDQDFSAFFQLDLEDVGWRYCPRSAIEWIDQSDRWWRLRADQARRSACLSDCYDLFITVTHNVPPFCHAPRGLLYVLFPAIDRLASWPWNEAVSFGWRGAVNGCRRHLYEQAWQARLATYDRHLAISRFAADWTARYWGASCEVLPPPVSCEFVACDKVDQIAVVGRFVPVKKQRDLVIGFREAQAVHLPGWSLACLGGLSEDPVHQAYFEEIQASAADAPVRLLPNIQRHLLRAELERSKVFWHGMGLGMDEERNPFKLEHFGIATVEAMAAGCVPVVINKGGQREIVEHSESGFLCANVEEMVEATTRLARDDALRARMAKTAAARAQDYSCERFIQRFEELARPLLTSNSELPPRNTRKKMDIISTASSDS